MTFEQLRITFQSDEQMARSLYAQLVQVEAALSIAEAQRNKLKKEQAQQPARRTHRGEK